MKVLIITNPLLAAFPTGAAYVAGAVLKAGHEVDVFNCHFAAALEKELKDKINTFHPDVIGISLKYLGPSKVKARAKKIVDCIKSASDAPIVLGGCGFNYFGSDWLEFLDLDYGIRGEGERSFPLYLKRLAEGGDIYDIPGCIYRKNGNIQKEPRDFNESGIYD